MPEGFAGLAIRYGTGFIGAGCFVAEHNAHNNKAARRRLIAD